MDILRFAVAAVAVIMLTLSALVVRNDTENKQPWATVALALSMAVLCTIR